MSLVNRTSIIFVMMLLFSFMLAGCDTTTNTNPQGGHKENSPNPVLIPVDDPRLQYIGRIDFSQPGVAHYDWAGVQIKFRVQSPSVVFLLQDGGSDYNVFVDGQLANIIVTQPNVNDYKLELSNGVHEVILHKRHGGNYGSARFSGLQLGAGGTLLSAPKRASRKIEFIGDSTSVGYGVEGLSKKCDSNRPYENNWLAFPQVTARALDAEAYVIAVSGKGAVRNYGGKQTTSENPMPFYYQRTVFSNPDAKWDFTKWVPDTVVIKLGTNDYSTQPAPSETEFVSGVNTILQTVRGKYGNKIPIFLVADDAYDIIMQHMQTIVKQQNAKGHHSIWYVEIERGNDDELGCDWHPKSSVHQRMAKTLALEIKTRLDW